MRFQGGEASKRRDAEYPISQSSVMPRMSIGRGSSRTKSPVCLFTLAGRRLARRRDLCSTVGIPTSHPAAMLRVLEPNEKNIPAKTPRQSNITVMTGLSSVDESQKSKTDHRGWESRSSVAIFCSVRESHLSRFANCSLNVLDSFAKSRSVRFHEEPSQMLASLSQESIGTESSDPALRASLRLNSPR